MQPYNIDICAVWVQNLVSQFEEHRLRVFENRVVRRIFGPKREEDDHEENCIMMKFVTCILFTEYC
jgi:hypothetical protein